MHVTHLTELADGSFHFIDYETGTSSLITSILRFRTPQPRRTNTEVFNLTPGGTFTHTETLQQSDATLRIQFQVHLTVLNGEPKVDREVMMVRACP